MDTADPPALLGLASCVGLHLVPDVPKPRLCCTPSTHMSIILGFLDVRCDNFDLGVALSQVSKALCPPELCLPRRYTALDIRRHVARAVCEHEDSLAVEVRIALERMQWLNSHGVPLDTRIDEFEDCAKTLIGHVAPAELALCEQVLSSGEYEPVGPWAVNPLEEFSAAAREELFDMGRQEQELRRDLGKEQLDRVLDMIRANKEIRRLRSIISVRDEALQMIRDRAYDATPADMNIVQLCDDALDGYDIVDMECWRSQQDGDGAGGFPPSNVHRV